jgi:hypothetical protein
MRRATGQLRPNVMTMFDVSVLSTGASWEEKQSIYQLDWAESTVLTHVVVAYPCCSSRL